MDDQKKMESLNTLNNTHSIDKTDDPAIFKLDDDCMRHIFSYLNIPERIRIQRVCTTWQLLGKLPWTDQKILVVKNEIYDHYGEEMAIEIKDSIQTLPILKQVLGLCGSSLTDVYIDHFDEENVAVGILTLIHEYCPNLSKLHIAGIKITDTVIEYLCRHYNELKRIVIGRCDSHYEDALLRYFQLNVKLCFVSFYRLDNLTGSCLLGISDNIEEVGIDDCSELKFQYVLDSMKKWKNLRSLAIFDTIPLLVHIDELLHALPNKSNLEKLILDTFTYSHSKHLVQQINNMHHFTNLRFIRLTGNTVLFDQMLTELGKYCVHITHAYLARSTRITDMGWQNFVKFLNLESLVLYELKGLSDKFLNYPLKSSLKAIKFGRVPVTNESLRSLMQTSENLKLMEICDCMNVDTNKLKDDALAITNLRPNNNILRLEYVGGDGDNEEQILSPRLIVKKVCFRCF